MARVQKRGPSGEIIAADKKRASVRKWYAENREDHNASRRKKYAKDKGVRKKAQDRVRAYREKGGGTDIDRSLERTYKGKTIKVYSTGTVATRLNATSQMIRNWQKKGWILNTLFEGTHRLYTENQLDLMRGLHKLISETPSRVALKEPLAQYLKEIKKHWKD